MDIYFEPSGSFSYGINDAGIATFRSDPARHVTRECAQNSLDAPASSDNPVRLHITRKSVERDKLPFMDDLHFSVKSCLRHWPNDGTAQKFFKEAQKLTVKNKCEVLHIADYGTTGVPDERWFGLVESMGSSVQSSNSSGGAFGIGKSAPFVCSKFRTILYSTKTVDGKSSMKGVSRLVTHKNSQKETVSHMGAIGRVDSPNKECHTIRDNEIPDFFRRTKPGLDIWCLGYKPSEKDWSKPFIRAALASFWPSIYFRKIIFKIGDKEINHDNLGEWMVREKNDSNVADQYPFYAALTDSRSHNSRSKLSLCGDCSLDVLFEETPSDKPLPKKIALTRKTGMIIDTYAPRNTDVPFSGIFQCTSDTGNALLKSIEPPEHNKWDEKWEGSSRDAKKALKELKSWIKDCISEKAPAFENDEFNEDSVSDILPDEEPPENPEAEDSDGKDLTGVNELGGTNHSGKFQVKVSTSRDGGRGQGSGGDGGGEGDSTDGGNDGDGKNTGGSRGTQGDSGDEGGSEREVKRIHLRARTFIDASKPDRRQIVLRSDDEKFDGSVKVLVCGEDNNLTSVKVLSASQGKTKLNCENDRIHGIKIKKGESLSISAKLEDLYASCDIRVQSVS